MNDLIIGISQNQTNSNCNNINIFTIYNIKKNKLNIVLN